MAHRRTRFGLKILNDHLLNMSIAPVKNLDFPQRGLSIVRRFTNAHEDARGEGNVQFSRLGDVPQTFVNILSWLAHVGQKRTIGRLQH